MLVIENLPSGDHYRLPLVGGRFRPPAIAIINSLPVGCPVWLLPEPLNPYDQNAIAVMLFSSDIPKTSYPLLEDLAPGYGHSLEEILATTEWHLGYIAKDHAKDLKLDARKVGFFGLSLDGSPRVFFPVPSV